MKTDDESFALLLGLPIVVEAIMIDWPKFKRVAGTQDGANHN